VRRRSAALPAVVAVALTLVVSSCASEPKPKPDPAASSSSASSSATQAATEVTPAKVDPALAVDVTGDPGVKPTVTVKTPLSVTDTTKKIITQGTGPEITRDDTVEFAYSLYAGTTGAQVDSSWGGQNARFEVQSITRGIARGLLGGHVGDRVAIAIAPADGFGANAANFGEGLDENTTFVLVADLVNAYVAPTKATGQAVTPPADLPAVTVGADGIPTGFTVSATTTKTPTDTVAQPLIKGSGPVVASGQTVKMQYVGATLADGKVFQSSWTAQAFTTTIGTGQVIKGWDKGIVGQTVGSRVELVIPADQAYGDAPTSGQPAGALVFVVDILDAY
jgi:peptidylprolyl isomerase